MPRSELHFSKAFAEVKFHVKMHKKQVWLVPTENDYRLSVIKPNADELPFGTRAVQYSVELSEVDFVDSSKTCLLYTSPSPRD